MPTQETVLVSILLAARNEEANILQCLSSLAALNYPIEKIEICIGDDDSEDRTADLVINFIANKPQFRYFKINSSVPGLKGKSNVLAQLAAGARGKYFLFCDADIAVPVTWVNVMEAHLDQGTGVVVGVTRMKKSTMIADFLSLEWLFVLGSIHLASLYKIPITGLGNNMAVSKDAYVAVGGYEKIGFSIVEDYALFMAVVRAGFDFQVPYDEKILSQSESVNSIKELYSQRKRWMHGVMQANWTTKFTIILSAATIPVLLILMLWLPKTALILLLLHYIAVTGASVATIVKLRQRDLWPSIFFFWFYMFLVSLSMLAVYILPGKTTWKGRKY